MATVQNNKFEKAIAYKVLPSMSFMAAVLLLMGLILPTSQINHDGLLVLDVVVEGQKQVYDGPSVWVGLFRSCWQEAEKLPTTCSRPRLHPNWNVSVFNQTSQYWNETDNPLGLILARPDSFPILSIMCCTAVTLLFLHSFLSVLMNFREKLGKTFTEWMDSKYTRFLMTFSAIAILVLSISFSFIYMVLRKTRDDFNGYVDTYVAHHDSTSPHLFLSLGTGFPLVLASYGLALSPFAQTFLPATGAAPEPAKNTNEGSGSSNSSEPTLGSPNPNGSTPPVDASTGATNASGVTTAGPPTERPPGPG